MSEETGAGVPDLVRAFGEYAFEPLLKSYPDSIAKGSTLKEFLKNVHGIIHVEVKKLYQDASPPEFEYEEPEEDELVMIYRSERNLPWAAEGLILGAAKHFGQDGEVGFEEVEEASGPAYRFLIKFK